MSDEAKPEAVKAAGPADANDPALAKWIGLGLGAGIGSAAIAAALLYANNGKGKRKRQ